MFIAVPLFCYIMGLGIYFIFEDYFKQKKEKKERDLLNSIKIVNDKVYTRTPEEIELYLQRRELDLLSNELFQEGYGHKVVKDPEILKEKKRKLEIVDQRLSEIPRDL